MKEASLTAKQSSEEMAALRDSQQAAAELLQEEREKSHEHSRIMGAMQEENLRQVSNMNVELSNVKEALGPLFGLLGFVSSMLVPTGRLPLMMYAYACWTKLEAALYLTLAYGRLCSCSCQKVPS